MGKWHLTPSVKRLKRNEVIFISFVCFVDLTSACDFHVYSITLEFETRNSVAEAAPSKKKNAITHYNCPNGSMYVFLKGPWRIVSCSCSAGQRFQSIACSKFALGFVRSASTSGWWAEVRCMHLIFLYYFLAEESCVSAKKVGQVAIMVDQGRSTEVSSTFSVCHQAHTGFGDQQNGSFLLLFRVCGFY